MLSKYLQSNLLRKVGRIVLSFLILYSDKKQYSISVTREKN